LLVLPVGATEQHGSHLPLGTDFLIVEHVSRAAAGAARADFDVLVAPTLQTGSSHHHLPFGGTI
jgi:creatinine amidohydrolase